MDDTQIFDPEIRSELEVPPLTEEQKQQLSEELVPGKVWRRWLAAFVDMLIIAIPLFIVGYVLRNITFRLGPWGKLIGFAIYCFYWARFNSEVKNGQTIGKRFFKLQTVSTTGELLPLRTSLVRAGLLGLILILSSFVLPILQTPAYTILMTIVGFGFGLASAYGIIFNRDTRQTLYDFWTNSRVVEETIQRGHPTSTTSVKHRNIMYGLIALVGLFALVANTIDVTRWLPSSQMTEIVTDLTPLLEALYETDDYFSVNVQHRFQSTFGGGGSSTSETLIVYVWFKEVCSADPQMCEQKFNEIAETVFEMYPQVNALDGMTITIDNRFDFGLVNGNFSRHNSLPIAYWRSELGLP